MLTPEWGQALGPKNRGQALLESMSGNWNLALNPDSQIRPDPKLALRPDPKLALRLDPNCPICVRTPYNHWLSCASAAQFHLTKTLG